MKPSAAIIALADHLEGATVVQRSADDVLRRVRTHADLDNFPSRDRQFVFEPLAPLPRPSNDDNDDTGNWHAQRRMFGLELRVGYRIGPSTAERVLDDSEVINDRLMSIGTSSPTLFVSDLESDVDVPTEGVMHLLFTMNLHYEKD